MLLGVLLCVRITGYIGLPRSRLDLGLSTGIQRYLFVRRPPQTCVYGFILPRAFRLLQSSATNDLLPVSQKTLRPSDRPESASLGVPSLIAASTSGVHHSPGNPLPDFVPPSAFLTPSTVCSATSLAGLFHPAATSRVCPSGVYPSPRSRTGFPRPCHALLPFNAPACDQRMRPRLQGLAPRGECGAVRDRLKTRSIRAPHGLLLLRVFSPHTVEAPSRPRRPRPFTAMSPPQLVLDVLPVRGSAFLYPGFRPAQGLWPELPSSFRKTGSRPYAPSDPPSHRARGDIEHSACQSLTRGNNAETGQVRMRT